jgi:hypothetical protein
MSPSLPQPCWSTSFSFDPLLPCQLCPGRVPHVVLDIGRPSSECCLRSAIWRYSAGPGVLGEPYLYLLFDVGVSGILGMSAMLAVSTALNTGRLYREQSAQAPALPR